MGGGGGDDGGAAAQASADKARRAAAIKKLNLLFGQGDPVPVGPEPNKNDFAIKPKGPANPFSNQYNPYVARTGAVPGQQSQGYGVSSQPNIDEAAYQAALSKWRANTQPDPVAASNLAKRQATYDDVRSTVRDFNKTKLDKDRAEALRLLSFQLARTGNLGGSVDIDQKTQAQDIYDKGLIQVADAGNAAATDL